MSTPTAITGIGPLAAASLASHGSGLLTLFVVAYKFETHYAYIAYLLVQMPVYVLMTHLLASDLYRVNFRSPFVRRSLEFGLPLLMGGVGVAIMSQGDRWIVGSMLGLPLLGLYSLISLSALVPLGGILKVLSPVLFAGLHNAKVELGEYDARLKLYSRAVPVLAALFSLSMIALYGELLPLVFGRRYSISDSQTFLLAMLVYIRIIRTDPQTSMLFNGQNTRGLAIAGQAPFIGLVVTAGLVFVHPTLKSVLIGGVVGEFAGLCVIGFVVRRFFGSALYDHVFSSFAMFTVVVAAGITMMSSQIGDVFLDRIAAIGGFMIFVLTFAALSLPFLYKKAYGESSFGLHPVSKTPS